MPTPTILLKTDCEPGPDGAAYRTAFRYDPATRTVTSLTTTVASCTTYSRPQTDLVDSFCLNPGQSPFTRRDVYHDGAGGVGFVDTNGVATCAPAGDGCTLRATVITETEGVNTLGTATVSATRAVGAVQYSLDDFQTSNQPTGAFVDLPAGAYVATVREVRPLGCTVRVPFLITTTYGARFTLPFVAFDGAVCRVDIALRGYTGTAETLCGAGPGCVVLHWPGSSDDHVFDGPVRGSECELRVLCETKGQLADLYGSDERQALVSVWRGSSRIWVGWCLPEQWTEPLLFPPFASTIRASDGLGALSSKKAFGYENGLPLAPALLSHFDTLRHCFALAGFRENLPMFTTARLWSERMTPDEQADFLLWVGTWTHGWQDDKGKPWDAGQVLSALLDYYAARLYQWGAAWHFVRTSDLSAYTGARRISYDEEGARIGIQVDYRPETTVTPPPSAGGTGPFWVTAAQTLGLLPAVREVVLTNDEKNAPLNLLPECEQWPANAFLPGGRLWRWTGAAPYSRQLDPSDLKKHVLLLEAGASNVQYVSRTVRVAAADLARGGSFLTLYLDIETSEAVTGLVNQKPLRVAFFVNGVNVPGFASAGGVWNGVRVQEIGFPYEKRAKVALTVRADGYLIDPNPAVFFTPPIDVEIRLYPSGMLGTGLLREMRFSWGWLGGEVNFGEYTNSDPIPTERYQAKTGIAHATRTDEADVAMTEAADIGSYTFGPATTLDSPTVFQRGVGMMGGGAVRRWFEESTGPQAWTAYLSGGGVAPGRAMQDYAARDRALWQRQPAEVLRGTLRGWLPHGPGTLLADPAAGPNLFIITDCSYDVTRAEWAVTAVEMNTARATVAIGDYLLLESGDRLLLESGAPIPLES